MSTPVLSIIIPVYNTGDSVNRMVNSILSQTFSDFELILVNDGSTDDTPGHLEKLAANDERVLVLTKENGGPSSARNLGLGAAKGEYIQFYDSDDLTVEGTLDKIIKIAAEKNSDMVISGWQIDLKTKKGMIENYKTINPPADTLEKDLKKSVLKSIGSDGTLYNLWNKLLRADIIKQNNLRFREDLRFGEDVIFALEYMEFVSRIDIIPEVTYRYQVGSSTSVFSKSSLVPEYRQENDRAIVKFVGQNPAPDEFALLQWVRWRWLMSYWSLVAASDKSLKEKTSLIKQFQPENLRIPKSSSQIGIKKYLTILLASLARFTPLGSLILCGVHNFTKQSVISLKSLAKR